MSLLQVLPIATGVIACPALVYFALSGPQPARELERRLQSVRLRYSESTKDKVEAQLRKAVASRRPGNGPGAGTSSRRRALAHRLHRTGRSWTIKQYAIVSVALTFTVTLMVEFKTGAPLLALATGLFFGVAVPHLVIGHLASRRLAAFTARFPDAIELLVRGLRAGLPVADTLSVVGSEVVGPVGEEFKLVGERIRIGKQMDDALQDTANRLQMPEFTFFCIALAIQRETGGNLAETLANLAEVLRKRSQIKLKVKAMSAEAKASAMIIGALPIMVFLLVLWVNPDYLDAFFTDRRLMVAGLGGLGWMALGAVIMARMVNFKL